MLIFAGAVAMSSSAEAGHVGGQLTYQGNPYNGYKIFLSPAHHTTGDKYGCLVGPWGITYHEERNMRDVAINVTNGGALANDGLVDRGYAVRIGSGDLYQNSDNANAWGAHRYIALHSNGTTSDGRTCSGTRGGTETYNYYGNSAGSYLAQELLNMLGSQSPGTGDKREPRTDFPELSRPRMPVAYVEAGFHDYRPDAEWLVSHANWAWRIAAAVDIHLGYP